MISPRLLTETSLSQKAAAGNQQAFEEIFRRFHQDVFRYCRSILRNDQDAMDALQATMAAALASLPGERREIKLKPWLFRVAHNECIDLMKAQSKLSYTEEPVDSGYALESEVADRERLRQVLADIARLPEGQRSALIMRELNGLDFEDMGFALGCSAAAARQAVYEARLSLSELESGRQMRCDDARQAISSMDGRVMRGRKLRAHLRSCQGCQGFRAAARLRQEELRSLVPILPAAAAASVLGAVGGGSSGLGGGILAFFGGSGAAAGVGGKAVAIVAVAAVGVGAGTVGVVKEIESRGDRGSAGSGLVSNSGSSPRDVSLSTAAAAGLPPGQGPGKGLLAEGSRGQEKPGAQLPPGAAETGTDPAAKDLDGEPGRSDGDSAAASPLSPGDNESTGGSSDGGKGNSSGNGKSDSAPGRSPSGPPGHGSGRPTGAGGGNAGSGGNGPPQHSQGQRPSTPTPPPRPNPPAATPPGKPPAAGSGGSSAGSVRGKPKNTP
jgi:RNA polymerase sigma factor (sigma-70 family)